MDNNQNNNPNNNKNKKNVNGLLILVAWAIVLTVVFNYLSAASRQANTAASTHEIHYSEFQDLVEEGVVEEVLFADGQIRLTTKEGYVYTDEEGNTYDKNFTLFTMQLTDPDVVDFLRENGVKNYTRPYVPEMSPILEFMIAYILPMVLFIGAVMLFMNLMARKGGGIGGIGSVGKSNAKVYMEKTTGVTFSDVAGQDEAKESLVEIIDFLHNPGKYTAIGAKLPKGALLVGSPGTGKTLLAKAVAGEAGVPFFSISGSGFVEMFVGVGASRVRDLFQEAAKVAPCIIFIDEIDTIGKSRDNRMGGNDEREQTLNQLLVEMDGFAANEGVIVLAATNRQDILDPALLRPGRFDRQVYVGRPDSRGREEILAVHTRNKPLAEDVDLKVLAQSTSGFTGADLENLVNEGALLSARKGQKFITMDNLQEAVIKVIAGPEKRSRVVPEHERKLTAYHEAGHAVMHHCLPSVDPVHEVTIIPRGQAGGMTISLPGEDRGYYSKRYMEEEIAALLGGRVAESLFLDDISTGASNDIQRASEIARKMVTAYGMSERLGSVSFDSGSDEVFIGRSMAQAKTYSEEVAAQIDQEVKAIIDAAYRRCQEVLSAHREQMEAAAAYLLEHETMSGEDFAGVMGFPKALAE